jgi:carboxymethylenebutenolidase
MTNTLRASSEQQLLEVWQHHVHSEFVLKDAKRALTTMSRDPHVLFVPIATGGRGREGVLGFYRDYFLAQLPADIRPIAISQVVGKDTLVEEAVYQFTHDQIMDWIVPGVAPTRKSVEIGVVAIVKFENAKIASEHVYWDHASVLVQLGILDPAKVPVKGVETARTLLDWVGIETAA